MLFNIYNMYVKRTRERKNLDYFLLIRASLWFKKKQLGVYRIWRWMVRVNKFNMLSINMFCRLFGSFDERISKWMSFFCSYLLHQLDVNIIQICLDAIANILRQTFKDNLENVKHEIEECGGMRNEICTIIIVFVWIGLESIENLQNHVSQQISRQAFEIIERYYSNVNH